MHRIAIVVALGAVAMTARDAAACTLPRFFRAMPDTRYALPPEPTLYMASEDVFLNSLRADPKIVVSDEDGAVPLRIRQFAVGDRMLFAVTVRHDEGAVDLLLDGTPLRYRISPDAVRAQWAFAGPLTAEAEGWVWPSAMFDSSRRRATMHVPLHGHGVGYWRVETQGCATFAFMPEELTGGGRASIPRACIAGGGGVDVTAVFRDGTQRRLPTMTFSPRRPFNFAWLWVTGLASFALLAGLVHRGRRLTRAI